MICPIPIKPNKMVIPILDNDNDNNNIFTGLLLKNNFIEKSKSENVISKSNKIKIKFGYGISKRYNHKLKNKIKKFNLVYASVKYILYINKNNKIIRFYKLYDDYNNCSYNFIDDNFIKYKITNIKKNNFYIFNIVHSIINRY